MIHIFAKWSYRWRRSHVDGNHRKFRPRQSPLLAFWQDVTKFSQAKHVPKQTERKKNGRNIKAQTNANQEKPILIVKCCYVVEPVFSPPSVARRRDFLDLFRLHGDINARRWWQNMMYDHSRTFTPSMISNNHQQSLIIVKTNHQSWLIINGSERSERIINSSNNS
jgi:hypothetical protein